MMEAQQQQLQAILSKWQPRKPQKVDGQASPSPFPFLLLSLPPS